jgi:hypothetical protein
VFQPLSIVISAVPTSRIKLVCCAVRRPMMRWGGHGRMRVCCVLSIIPIGIRRGLMGEAMVDRGGCDGIEKFIDGSALVCMRVVHRPIHSW